MWKFGAVMSFVSPFPEFSVLRSCFFFVECTEGSAFKLLPSNISAFGGIWYAKRWEGGSVEWSESMYLPIWGLLQWIGDVRGPLSIITRDTSQQSPVFQYKGQVTTTHTFKIVIIRADVDYLQGYCLIRAWRRLRLIFCLSLLCSCCHWCTCILCNVFDDTRKHSSPFRVKNRWGRV